MQESAQQIFREFPYIRHTRNILHVLNLLYCTANTGNALNLKYENCIEEALPNKALGSFQL